ncbi:MAG: ABC transporter permease subunit [Rhodospirillales bacterium]|nr:ABC transporter permease subunit [Rhodospirillales bacterium]MDE2198732.1 ABC transporter permease subunit [Rhodospirillales bacterium]MDE2575690.1 ABC transporter permease subunit [Rhodospirillales bacterium]
MSGAALAPAPGRLAVFWRSFGENRGAIVGLTIMGMLVLVSVFAGVAAPLSPIQQFREHFLAPPIWQSGGVDRFLLGTDDVGRDILSRLIYGARLSLLIGMSVVALSLCTGTVLGLTAAFAGGLVDIVIMRVMDILLVFPSLLLAIVIVAILGPGLFNAMLAVAVVALPGYTRLARASALAELARDYVSASRSAGASTLRLMFDTVLPNCTAPLIVQATLGFSSAILDAAALGFLGLGAQPPTPEWGTMLAGALQFYQRAWWVLAFPGLAILFTVLAFNLFGDGLRDALDPKLKR